jgi:Xaa-Pro aminopeptidase
MLVNLERARQVMQREGLDALIGVLSENVIYLTDTEAHIYFSHAIERDAERDYYAILPLREDIPPTYVCTASTCTFLVDQPTWMNVRVYGDYEAAPWEGAELSQEDRAFIDLVHSAQTRRLPAPHTRAAATALKELGLGRARIGVDDMRAAARLASEDLDCQFVDAYELFREIRAVKTPEEAARLKASSEKNDIARDAVYEHVREGITWGELKLVYDKRMLELGCVPRFWAAGCGPWPYRHCLWQDGAPALTRRVKSGDVIRLDIGGTYKHYWSDTAKVGFFNAPVPDSYTRAMAALKAAREEYEAMLRPGTRVADLLRVGEETVRKFNIPGFKRLWGHGIGLQWYEWPRVTKDSRDELEEGMVFNLEGGPSGIPWGGVNLEMTYAITRNGFECWTQNNDYVWQS